MISFKSPKKIRIFAPDFPFPIRAGADHVVAHQWCGLLELGHDVELVCWRETRVSLEEKLVSVRSNIASQHPMLETLLPQLRYRILAERPHPVETVFQRALRTARSLLAGDASPEWVYYPPHPELLRAYWELSSQSPVDLEIFSSSLPYPWLKRIEQSQQHHSTAPHRVVHYYNLEADLFRQRSLAEKNPIKRWVFELNSKRLNIHEAALLGENLIDEGWFLSRQDQSEFEARNGPTHKTRLMPPVLASTLRPKPIARKERSPGTLTLGLVANFDYKPNLDSLDWVMHTLIPKLESRSVLSNSRIKILIAGKGVPDSYQLQPTSSSNTELCFLGFVENLDVDFWPKIDLSLSPCVSGSGVRIKGLDAIQRGVPVLTHPQALETLPSSASSSILAAQTVEEWVEVIMSTQPTKTSQLLAGVDGFAPSNHYL